MVNHNLISMEQLLYLEYKSLHDLRRRVKPELIWIRECINYLKERAAPFGIDLDFWTVDFFLENVEDMPKSLQADLYRAWYFTDLNEEIVRHNKKVEILLWHIRRRRGILWRCLPRHRRGPFLDGKATAAAINASRRSCPSELATSLDCTHAMRRPLHDSFTSLRDFSLG